MKASAALCALALGSLLATSSWAWVSAPRHRRRFISPLRIFQGSEALSGADHSGESDEVRLARARLIDGYGKVGVRTVILGGGRY